MNRLRQIKAIIKSINQHPLARKHRFKAYYKFFYWQISSIIIPRPKKIAFTDKSFLLVKKGMKGATGNIYTGLHDFLDMGFLLHFLRKDDLFFDIGANIGSYMVLASGHVEARTFAFEPVPTTFQSLKNNIVINKIESLVTPYNLGVGSKHGELNFTITKGTVNHVITASSTFNPENSVRVSVVTIDEIAGENTIPLAIKIDVEGFETEVIKGMVSTLSNSKLKAIIIELNGSGGRYGYDENLISQELLDAGFKPFEYDPFTRDLKELKTYNHLNTLYLRDLSFIKNRLEKAAKIFMFSEIF